MALADVYERMFLFFFPTFFFSGLVDAAVELSGCGRRSLFPLALSWTVRKREAESRENRDRQRLCFCFLSKKNNLKKIIKKKRFLRFLLLDRARAYPAGSPSRRWLCITIKRAGPPVRMAGLSVENSRLTSIFSSRGENHTSRSRRCARP